MEKIKCPICNEESEYLIVDLNICNGCSHIFKTEPRYIGKDVLIEHLHNYVEPIIQLRDIYNKCKNGQILSFIFPSLMLYDLEISPNKFYNAEYNHYFNQMSLMLLIKQCGFKIITQQNKWKKNVCVTKLEVIKE